MKNERTPLLSDVLLIVLVVVVMLLSGLVDVYDEAGGKAEEVAGQPINASVRPNNPIYVNIRIQQ